MLCDRKTLPAQTTLAAQREFVTALDRADAAFFRVRTLDEKLAVVRICCTCRLILHGGMDLVAGLQQEVERLFMEPSVATTLTLLRGIGGDEKKSEVALSRARAIVALEAFAVLGAVLSAIKSHPTLDAGAIRSMNSCLRGCNVALSSDWLSVNVECASGAERVALGTAAGLLMLPAAVLMPAAMMVAWSNRTSLISLLASRLTITIALRDAISHCLSLLGLPLLGLPLSHGLCVFLFSLFRYLSSVACPVRFSDVFLGGTGIERESCLATR